jgi:SnoaL-like domain
VLGRDPVQVPAVGDAFSSFSPVLEIARESHPTAFRAVCTVLSIRYTVWISVVQTKGKGMADELEVIVRQMLEGLDKGDASLAMANIADDVQGIDEISRRWMRGKNELGAYVQQAMGMLSDVHSEMRDVHERVWGDSGVLTCWLEQDYTMEGDRKHISAPTTVVLRRDGGSWQIELLLSLPLPEES